jgi:NAD(P)-dependent dehydrogenase (short-subunit alcohol dehydrogenase family)
MSENRKTNPKGKQVCVVIGATSKWQADGRNTLLAHGHTVDDSELPVGVRWGVGGAIAQKFAQEGFSTVLTTRKEANASALAQAIQAQGGECMIVELDLVSQDSIASAFATIRSETGDPDVLVYNAGYLEGRDLPPDKELLEHVPLEILDTALHIACRGPFLVAKEVLPAMRKKGAGSFFFSNNSNSLRGKKRMTGQSLYYPRVMMRTLAQVLTEEYSEQVCTSPTSSSTARSTRPEPGHCQETRTAAISSSIRSRSPRLSGTCTRRTGRAGPTSFS